jgi:hypothetical protein
VRSFSVDSRSNNNVGNHGKDESHMGMGRPPPLTSTSVLNGFYFKRRTERLDWRLLAALQVEKIHREVDIESLQEIMENITFCDVDSEDLRYVDPNYIKLFKLSQMIIEYLLHSQVGLCSYHPLTTKA